MVPVRNGSGLIACQLDALSEQSIAPHIEIVVVDDASEDSTASVVESWADRHPAQNLTLLRRDRRGGVNASRNAGINVARGPFILLCDGDDVVAPGWAEVLVSKLEARAGLPVLVTGPCVALNAEGRPSEQVLFDRLMVRDRQYMLGGNGGFPRQLAIEIGGFDEQMFNGGTEVDFSLRAFDVGATVVHCEEAVIGYRIPSGGAALLVREFRRSRGRAYLAMRHGPKYGVDRRFDAFMTPWRHAAGSVIGLLRGSGSLGASIRLCVSAIGMTLWGLVFLWRRPLPRLGLRDGHDSDVR